MEVKSHTVTYEWTNEPEDNNTPHPSKTTVINGRSHKVDTTTYSAVNVYDGIGSANGGKGNLTAIWTFSGWDKKDTITDIPGNITIKGT